MANHLIWYRNPAGDQNKLLKEIKARITRLYNWSKEQTAKPENKSIMAQLWQARQETDQSDTLYGKIKTLQKSSDKLRRKSGAWILPLLSLGRITCTNK